MQGRGRPFHVRNVVCRWSTREGETVLLLLLLLFSVALLLLLLRCSVASGPPAHTATDYDDVAATVGCPTLWFPTNNTPRVCSRYSISCIAAGHGSCAWICSLVSRAFVRRTRYCCFNHPCGRGGFREASGVVAANALRSRGAFLL